MAEVAEKLDPNGNPQSWGQWVKSWEDYAVLKANNFADAANAVQKVVITTPGHAAAIAVDGAVRGTVKSVPGLVALGFDGADWVAQKLGTDLFEGSAVQRVDHAIDSGINWAQDRTGTRVEIKGDGDQALQTASSFVGGFVGGMGATRLAGMGASSLAGAFRATTPALDAAAAAPAAASVATGAENAASMTAKMAASAQKTAQAAAPSAAAPESVLMSKNAFIGGAGNSAKAAGNSAGLGADATAASSTGANAVSSTENWLMTQWRRGVLGRGENADITFERLMANGQADRAKRVLDWARVRGFTRDEQIAFGGSKFLDDTLKRSIAEQFAARGRLLGGPVESFRAASSYAVNHPFSMTAHIAAQPAKTTARLLRDTVLFPVNSALNLPLLNALPFGGRGALVRAARGSVGLLLDQMYLNGAIGKTEVTASRAAVGGGAQLVAGALPEGNAKTLVRQFGRWADNDPNNNPSFAEVGNTAAHLGLGAAQTVISNPLTTVLPLISLMSGFGGDSKLMMLACLVLAAAAGYAYDNNVGGLKDMTGNGLSSAFNSFSRALGYTAGPRRPELTAPSGPSFPVFGMS